MTAKKLTQKQVAALLPSTPGLKRLIARRSVDEISTGRFKSDTSEDDVELVEVVSSSARITT